MIIKIDGISYDMVVSDININGEFLYKYAERTEGGELKSEGIGFFENQSITIQANNSQEFVDFYNVMSTINADSTFNHEIEVYSPVGVYTALMYPDKLNISLKRIVESGNDYYGSMTVKFTAISKKV